MPDAEKGAYDTARLVRLDLKDHICDHAPWPPLAELI